VASFFCSTWACSLFFSELTDFCPLFFFEDDTCPPLLSLAQLSSLVESLLLWMPYMILSLRPFWARFLKITRVSSSLPYSLRSPPLSIASLPTSFHLADSLSPPFYTLIRHFSLPGGVIPFCDPLIRAFFFYRISPSMGSSLGPVPLFPKGWRPLSTLLSRYYFMVRSSPDRASFPLL